MDFDVDVIVKRKGPFSRDRKVGHVEVSAAHLTSSEQSGTRGMYLHWRLFLKWLSLISLEI
jgi:hypothetical protein